MNQSDNNGNIEWSSEQEQLLVEWCDIAQCYRWLNFRSHRTYTNMHQWFTIPTIVLSTLTGTASFAQMSIPIGSLNYTPYIIGTVTIFIGVLTTVQQYLKITELKENYRITAILWDKYARNIRFELARSPDERMDARNFLKLARNELDHLMETTPLISQNIIRKFKNKFMGKENSPERDIYDALRKPDILGSIISSETSRHHWFKDGKNLYRRKSIKSMTAPYRQSIRIIDDERPINLDIYKLSEKFDEIPNPVDLEIGLRIT